ncbi:MAG: hypothetical protein K0R15_1180 [Clostridiales bacterium]|jgi:hypothetical protein|nr:hypothetical protein [Clostridiales bacterium]
MKDNDENKEFEDDGRSFADMNVEGMPGYNKNRDKHREAKKNIEELNLTKKEKRSIVLASYSVIIPVAILFFGLIALFMLLLQFVWLR